MGRRHLPQDRRWVEERPLCSAAVGYNHGQRAGKPAGSVLLLSLCQSYQVISAPGFSYCSLRFSSVWAARQDEASVTVVTVQRSGLEECRHLITLPPTARSFSFIMGFLVPRALTSQGCQECSGRTQCHPPEYCSPLDASLLAGSRLAKKSPAFPAGS